MKMNPIPDSNNCMVFYPTAEEFDDWPSLMEQIAKSAKYGGCKVIGKFH